MESSISSWRVNASADRIELARSVAPLPTCRHGRWECDECRILHVKCAGTSSATAGRRIPPCDWGASMSASDWEKVDAWKRGACPGCNGFICVFDVREDWKRKGTDMSSKAERKRIFIRRLAEFLVGDQVRKSIELQVGKESGKEWAALRGATPLFGYPTVEEAEKVLLEFLE